MSEAVRGPIRVRSAGVLTRPEAPPASAPSTPLRLAVVTGIKEDAMPAPPSTKPGK